MDPTSNFSGPLSPPESPFTIPGFAAVGLGVIYTSVMVFMIGRYDKTGGALTVSVMVVIGFFAALTWAIRYQIPQDPETAALMGGLVAAFGAVVAYWIGGHGRQ